MHYELRAVALYDSRSTFCAKHMGQISANLHGIKKSVTEGSVRVMTVHAQLENLSSLAQKCPNVQRKLKLFA